MRRTICFLVLALAAMLSASSASADTACTAGNLSSIMGTSCNIGPIQFTFTSLYAVYNVTNDATGQVSDNLNFAASDFYLAPTTDGFTLTLLNGPQLMSASPGNIAGEDVFLSYNLLLLDPSLYVTGESVTSPGLSSTGSGRHSFATVTGWTTSQYFGQIYGGTVIDNNFGTVTSYPFVYRGGPNEPLSAGLSDPGVIGLLLTAYSGNNAYWSGSTDVSFTTAPVPEPRLLVMLTIGLLGLAGASLWKQLA